MDEKKQPKGGKPPKRLSRDAVESRPREDVLRDFRKIVAPRRDRDPRR